MMPVGSGRNVGNLSVQLTANTTAFKRAMQGVKGRLEGLGSAMRPIAAASAAAFAGMAGALAAVTAAAEGQRKAQLKLRSAIQGTGKAINPEKIEAFATGLQQITTFGDEATIEAAALLTTFQLTEDQILSMLPAVQNLAAMYGMDLNQAALSVGKALTAGAGALSRYGISLTETEKKAFNAANQVEKVAMMVQFLDKNTGPAAQNLARTAGGAFKQMQNAAGDFLEELGFIVESPITHFMQRLTMLIEDITKWVKNLTPEQKKWAAGLAIGAVAIAGVTAALTGLLALLPLLTAGFSTMAAAVNAALWPVTVAVLAIVGAVLQGIFVVGLFRKAWEKNMFGVQEKTKAWADNFAHNVRAIKANFKFMTKLAVKGWGVMINTMISLWNGFVSAHESAINKLANLFGKSVDLGTLKFGEVDVDVSGIDKIFEATKEAGGKAWDNISDTWMLGFETIAGPLKEKLLEILPSLKQLTPGMAEMTGGVMPPGAPAEAGPAAPVEEAAQQAQQSIADGLAMFGETLLQNLGQAGNLIAGVISKLASGDFMGALVQGTVGLLAQTKGFAKIMNIVNNLFSMVVQLVEPLIDAIMPLLKALADVAQLLIQMWYSLNFIGPIIDILTEVISVVARVIGFFVRQITSIWNWIIDVIASIVGWFSDSAAEWLREQKIVLQDFTKGQEADDELTDAVSDTADSFHDASTEMGSFSETMKDVNGKLSNVPRGFKVALRRFQSISGEMLGGGRPGLPGGEGGRASVFQIENMNVMAEDLQQLQSQIEEEAEWNRTVRTGSPLQGGPIYSVPELGG